MSSYFRIVFSLQTNVCVCVCVYIACFAFRKREALILYL